MQTSLVLEMSGVPKHRQDTDKFNPRHPWQTADDSPKFTRLPTLVLFSLHKILRLEQDTRALFSMLRSLIS